MSIRHLDQLLNPRSVALIGASDRPGSVGATVWRNLRAGHFAGPVHAVNPRLQSLDGEPVYAQVSALPSAPDLAVICIPPAQVPGVVTALGELGTRAAVVMTAGISGALKQAVLDAARPHLLRLLGPNCIGLLSPHLGLNASFAHTDALPGEVAFVSQSGALVTAVLDWATSRGIGFSHMVSLGERADVDFGDLLDHLASDRHTRSILLYIESIEAPRKFMSAARAAARNKPVIVVKAGRAGLGMAAAASHTGALAGSDVVFDAAIRRAGMLRVDTLQDLFMAAQTLARFGSNRDEALTLMTNGGGAGVMAADAAALIGVPLQPLAPELRAQLDAVLPPTWSHANPIDIIGDAPVQRYSDTLQAVLACWLGDAAVAGARRILPQAGAADYATPEEAVRAFALLGTYRRNQALLLEAPTASENGPPDLAAARAIVEQVLAEGRDMLDELEAKAVLHAYGIPVVPTQAVPPDADAVLAAAEGIGYPVVLKILSREISHKSDVGGVRLGLQNPAELRAAVDQMLDRVRALRPDAHITGFALQTMVRRPMAQELIVGASIDPLFGPVILFGQGGTAVEVLADRAIGLPPLNRVLARDLVSRTRVAKLLAGYRDRPPAQLDAIADVLIALSQLLADLPELAELDINPLWADHEGVLALDARLRVQRQPVAGAERFAITPYPAELVSTLHWQGEDLVLRPIRPEDEEQHRLFLEQIAPEDLRLRFFSSRRELPRSELARLTQIDYAREMAFIAVRESPGQPPETLGVVRAVTDPDNIEAEFAVIVRSDLKGQGLGALLMARLIDYLKGRGTQRVVGYVLRENTLMNGLAADLGFVQQSRGDSDDTLRWVLTLLAGTDGD